MDRTLRRAGSPSAWKPRARRAASPAPSGAASTEGQHSPASAIPPVLAAGGLSSSRAAAPGAPTLSGVLLADCRTPPLATISPSLCPLTNIIALTTVNPIRRVCRVPSPAGLERFRPRRSRLLLLEALRRRAGEAAPRLRQLRPRRPSPQAGAHRGSQPGSRLPEPPGGRGRLRRGSGRRPGPPGRGRAAHHGGGADGLLLRRSGQGLDRRPRRRAVGDLHRPRRRRRPRREHGQRMLHVSDVATERPAPPVAGGPDVPRRLRVVDRYLPVWILLAMAAGISLGRAVPGLDRHLDAIQVTSGTSLPIFVGLLVMMYPVLAKVRYGRLGAVTRDRRMLVSSLALNWLVGPAVMFALAWLMLPDQPAYRTGLIIVGLARCIAMVLVWNDLSCGDREAAAVLVALNSLFQMLMFSVLGWFYLQIL